MMESIIFFARTPQSGYGKTRLRQDISGDAVDAIARHLYERMFLILEKSRRRLVIYYAGNVPDKPVEVKPQINADLGRAMGHALFEEITHGPAILVGSDLIGIDENYIEKAFHALKSKDIVLGPAEDGGYGLIGMKDRIDVFEGITYSRDDVLENTVKKAKAQNKTVALLDVIYDIDDLSDLARAALKAPIVHRAEDDGSFYFTANNHKRIHLLKKHPSSAKTHYKSPTTMIPFFHHIEQL